MTGDPATGPGPGTGDQETGATPGAGRGLDPRAAAGAAKVKKTSIILIDHNITERIHFL